VYVLCSDQSGRQYSGRLSSARRSDLQEESEDDFEMDDLDVDVDSLDQPHAGLHHYTHHPALHRSRQRVSVNPGQLDQAHATPRSARYDAAPSDKDSVSGSVVGGKDDAVVALSGLVSDLQAHTAFLHQRLAAVLEEQNVLVGEWTSAVAARDESQLKLDLVAQELSQVKQVAVAVMSAKAHSAANPTAHTPRGHVSAAAATTNVSPRAPPTPRTPTNSSNSSGNGALSARSSKSPRPGWNAGTKGRSGSAVSGGLGARTERRPSSHDSGNAGSADKKTGVSTVAVSAPTAIPAALSPRHMRQSSVDSSHGGPESTLVQLTQQELDMQSQIVAQQDARLSRLHALVEQQRLEGERVRNLLAEMLSETAQQEGILAQLRESQQAATQSWSHATARMQIQLEHESVDAYERMQELQNAHRQRDAQLRAWAEQHVAAQQERFKTQFEEERSYWQQELVLQREKMAREHREREAAWTTEHNQALSTLRQQLEEARARAVAEVHTMWQEKNEAKAELERRDFEQRARELQAQTRQLESMDARIASREAAAAQERTLWQTQQAELHAQTEAAEASRKRWQQRCQAAEANLAIEIERRGGFELETFRAQQQELVMLRAQYREAEVARGRLEEQHRRLLSEHTQRHKERDFVSQSVSFERESGESAMHLSQREERDPGGLVLPSNPPHAPKSAVSPVISMPTVSPATANVALPPPSALSLPLPHVSTATATLADQQQQQQRQLMHMQAQFDLQRNLMEQQMAYLRAQQQHDVARGTSDTVQMQTTLGGRLGQNSNWSAPSDAPAWPMGSFGIPSSASLSNTSATALQQQQQLTTQPGEMATHGTLTTQSSTFRHGQAEQHNDASPPAQPVQAGWFDDGKQPDSMPTAVGVASTVTAARRNRLPLSLPIHATAPSVSSTLTAALAFALPSITSIATSSTASTGSILGFFLPLLLFVSCLCFPAVVFAISKFCFLLFVLLFCFLVGGLMGWFFFC
jgi:hypothetical protein